MKIKYEFQNQLSHGDWQGSDVSACYELGYPMVPNSP